MIRVLVVDNPPLLREGIAAVLGTPRDPLPPVLPAFDARFA